MDRNKLNCAIHAHRPVPCRGYDCRKDKRIWENFEEKILSTELSKLLERSDVVKVDDSVTQANEKDEPAKTDRFHGTDPPNINEGTHLISRKGPTPFQVVP